MSDCQLQSADHQHPALMQSVSIAVPGKQALGDNSIHHLHTQLYQGEDEGECLVSPCICVHDKSYHMSYEGSPGELMNPGKLVPPCTALCSVVHYCAG